MFPAAKAQFDLALAWSEFAMSTFTATTMMANAGAKVMAASAAVERINRQPPSAVEAFFAPWTATIARAPQPAPADPMRFAFAASQATMAFWSTLFDMPMPGSAQQHFWMPNFDAAPAKSTALTLPLWWTAFTDPMLAAAREPAAKGPAARSGYLH